MSVGERAIGRCGEHFCHIRRERGVASVWHHAPDGRAWYVCRYENKRNALAIWRGFLAQKGIDGEVIEL